MVNRFSHCPQCGVWVPSENLQTELDEETGTVIRVCTACLFDAGLVDDPGFNRSEFVYEPDHGKPTCLFCDSFNVHKTTTGWQCNDCGERYL